MIINFTIKKYWISTICVLLGSLSSFAQEFNDREIGFAVGQTIMELKQNGVNEPEEINKEIKTRREMSLKSFLIEKKNQDEILQKIQLEQNSKNSSLRTGVSLNIPQSEKDALLALYNSTNGINWKNKTGWDFNNPVTTVNRKNSWYGVTVTNGHVSSLSLRMNNLNGFIPVEIAELKYLVTLDLYSNGLTGSIPLEICQLNNLNLDYNLLTGSIPVEIGQLENLTVLSLASNRLKGNIPAEIGQLIKLEILDLGSIKFAYNSLTGEIPEEIGYLKELKSLKLSSNPLSGTIPYNIWSLTKLQYLALAYNQLSVSLPSEISQLLDLKNLDLMKNQLTGKIPSSIGALSSTLNILNLG